jgi:hypothetical protein
MSPMRFFATGKGAGKRQSHKPPITPATAAAPGETRTATQKARADFPVQAASTQLPHYPFQPLPPPNGPPPYRFDLSQLLSADDVAIIRNRVLVLHTVGDTGDYRDGGPQDLVAQMMTQDAENLTDDKKPAFYYHIGASFISPVTSTSTATIFTRPIRITRFSSSPFPVTTTASPTIHRMAR